MEAAELSHAAHEAALQRHCQGIETELAAARRANRLLQAREEQNASAWSDLKGLELLQSVLVEQRRIFTPRIATLLRIGSGLEAFSKVAAAATGRYAGPFE